MNKILEWLKKRRAKKMCSNCKYKLYSFNEYPCINCTRGVKRLSDKWEGKQK